MTILYRDLIPDKTVRDCMRHRVNNAIKRCYDPNCISFERYNHLDVFIDWLLDRRKFIMYLMTLPGWDNTELELDRIKNEIGYHPNNLRFSTRKEQARNQKHTLRLSYNSRTYFAVEFWELFCKDKCKYRHIQHIVRKHRSITGEQILKHLNDNIKIELIFKS